MKTTHDLDLLRLVVRDELAEREDRRLRRLLAVLATVATLASAGAAVVMLLARR